MWSIKRKIGKVYLIQITSFHSVDEMTSCRWQKIFASLICHKELKISRIYKELSKFNSEKTKQNKTKRIQLENGQKNMNRHFTKKDSQMATKHMKRCSTSLAIMEVKLKPQWDITAHPLEQKNENLWRPQRLENIRRNRFTHTLWWECKAVHNPRKQLDRFF